MEDVNSLIEALEKVTVITLCDKKRTIYITIEGGLYRVEERFKTDIDITLHISYVDDVECIELFIPSKYNSSFFKETLHKLVEK